MAQLESVVTPNPEVMLYKMRKRNRPYIEPELVRDADCPLVIGGGESKWDELKNSELGRQTLDAVRLGPNSVAYTLTSIRKLIAKLPRIQRPIDEGVSEVKPAPSFPKDREIRRSKRPTV